MARYKHTDVEEGQSVFLTINLKEQLVPETFEYMLNDLLGKKIDISMFDENYKNDKTGSKAIPPAALLKLIIYGYSKGIKSSRKLMDLNNENVIAKALTGDMNIHWTTIADFISSNSEKFQEVFIKVLTYCVELGLIGGKTFAIDGCRLPANVSINNSGTKKELEKKVEIYRRMAEKHVLKHIKKDGQTEMSKEEKKRYDKKQRHLNRQIEKINNFLKVIEPKKGAKKECKSNVTDNESATLRSPTGFIQGYIGIAVSDKENQIILNAQAEGSANEGEHLPDILDSTFSNLKEASVKIPEGETPVIMCDANYSSEVNLRACKEKGVEAIIPDKQHRLRLSKGGERIYEACDFEYNGEGNYYICPNGKRLEYKSNQMLGGEEGKMYYASVKDCRECPLNGRCLKTKKDINELKRGRSLLIKKSNAPGSLSTEMKKKLSTEEYRNQYAYRMQIIEPVFANITYCKGLDRFTLRRKSKVNGQWKLYCIVHNLGKCLKKFNEITKTA